ncbi:MAG: hypothetical protein OWP43_10470 [Sphaerochaetaceae bacterium]|nr:hypothetical protein [Sphaerochaetaceae bacterium]
MNQIINLTYDQAIIVTFFSAFLWGTWPISQKFLGNHSLKVFFLEMLFFSMIFVLSLSFIIKGRLIFVDINEKFIESPTIVFGIGICGFLFSASMFLNLYIISKIGLSIAQPLQQTIGLLLGTLFSVVIGGVPKNISFIRLLMCLILLILSIFFSYLSHKAKTKNKNREVKFLKIILLSFLCASIGSSYAFSISYGLKTITNPNGLTVLPFTSIFVVFAFLFVFLLNLISPSKNGVKNELKTANFRIYSLSIIAALFHYGGNMLHCLSTGLLSAAISWPLGLTSGLWTQLGGLLLGEFKGAKKSSYVFWGLSIIFYIIGAWILI